MSKKVSVLIPEGYRRVIVGEDFKGSWIIEVFFNSEERKCIIKRADAPQLLGPLNRREMESLEIALRDLKDMKGVFTTIPDPEDS